MTKEELYNTLKKTGLPVCYYEWQEDTEPPLPFICYYFTGNNDEAADGVNWATVKRVNIELYCKNKDFDAEHKLEQVLNDSDMFYEVSGEAFLQDDNMYETFYSVEVIIDG